MRRGALMFCAWGFWLAVLATVLAVWGEATVPVLVFGGAAAVAAGALADGSYGLLKSMPPELPEVRAWGEVA